MVERIDDSQCLPVRGPWVLKSIHALSMLISEKGYYLSLSRDHLLQPLYASRIFCHMINIFWVTYLLFLDRIILYFWISYSDLENELSCQLGRISKKNWIIYLIVLRAL